jgi:hypothetical protein
MYTVTAQDFASETGVSVGDLQEKARRGETVFNVDLAEYGVFEHYGDTRVLTKVRMPNSLAVNLGPGGVSETSAGDAYMAGRESMRPESSGGISQADERENVPETGESEGEANTSGRDAPDETETVEPEVEVVEQPPAEKESEVPAKRSNPSATVNQVFGLGAALAGVTVLCKMFGVDRNSGPLSGPLR